jgi:hypothetical protein
VNWGVRRGYPRGVKPELESGGDDFVATFS